MAKFGTFKIIEVLNNLNQVLRGGIPNKGHMEVTLKVHSVICNYTDLKIRAELASRRWFEIEGGSSSRIRERMSNSNSACTSNFLSWCR